MFHIEFYKKEDMTCPMEVFLDSLDSKLGAKAISDLELLKKNGNMLKKPHSEEIGDGIFELRTRFSNDICRTFYFFRKGKNIIVTNGYVKKTQKLSKKDFKLAKKYKADYERRF